MNHWPHNTIIGSLTALAILGCTHWTQAEIKFVPIGDASLAINSAKYDGEYAGTRTDSQGNTLSSDDESTGENAYIYFAPNLSFEELPGLWITPALEFEYKGANNVLNLDDEAFVFRRSLELYYLLGVNYKFNRNWSAKLKGFGRAVKAQEAEDETIYNGLYNFDDLGGWGEVSVRYRLGLPMRSRVGLKAYSRRYPFYTNKEIADQYKSLGYEWPAGLPQDLREKDVNNTELWLRQDITWGRLPILTNIEARLKDVQYIQMPAILSDGSFGDDLRHDSYLDITLEIPYYINEFYQLELDYAYRLRGSNQGVYDIQEYLYIPGYYNYFQNRVRLLFNFKFAFTITGFSPRGSIGISWQERQYLSRPARQQLSPNDSSGAYAFNNPHWESTTDFGITLRQQLFAKWLHLFLSLHSIVNNSNTNVEDGASYIFNYTTFTLGTAVSF